MATQKTWGGRFSGETDRRVEEFTESISYDRRLYRHDIIASQAHARMLAHVGILTAAEAEQIAAALDAIAGEIERGSFTFSTSLEDIHTHIEQALIARLGDVGRKLHTGRSRNDQVATDVKLWVRDALDGIDARLVDLQRALVESARRDRDIVLPGYTHLQRAQPVLAAHYFPGLRQKNTSAIANGSPTAGGASTCCRWGRRRWRAHRCRSIVSSSASSSASTAWRPTASTYRAIAISCWSSSSTWR